MGNELEKTNKEQDVKYKTRESTKLDKAVAEAKSDRSNVQTELDSALEYLKKLTEQCTEKVEPYEERAARRQAEIEGCKQALEILENESASSLIQQSVRRQKSLRRVSTHLN